MKVVYEVKQQVTEGQLQTVIDLLNRYEDLELTLDEVKANQSLLKYLCEGLVFCDGDIEDYWNNDGFCDVYQLRGE